MFQFFGFIIFERKHRNTSNQKSREFHFLVSQTFFENNTCLNYLKFLDYLLFLTTIGAIKPKTLSSALIIYHEPFLSNPVSCSSWLVVFSSRRTYLKIGQREHENWSKPYSRFLWIGNDDDGFLELLFSGRSEIYLFSES